VNIEPRRKKKVGSEGLLYKKDADKILELLFYLSFNDGHG
jgi:hypothetical protein